MYVYIKEKKEPVFVVGFYDPEGQWQPESDHDTPEDAAKRVAWLNGSGNTAAPEPAAVEKEEEDEELKQIDWSKVNFHVVPVIAFNVRTSGDRNAIRFLKKYKKTDNNNFFDGWINGKYATLITGKRIAWDGGECPLPEGVIVRVWMRDRNLGTLEGAVKNFRWNNKHVSSHVDIISFEVIGLEKGYREGWEQDA